VRLDALRSLLALRAPEAVDGLVRMIDDPESTVASAAIVLAGEYRSPEVVEALLRALDGWDFFRRRRTARLNALRALGRIGDPVALPRLGRFFESWLAALFARAERRAAYRSLAGYAEPDRRVIVGRGLASRDEEIREMCRQLAAAASRETG
jgi:HEAT repeat protein